MITEKQQRLLDELPPKLRQKMIDRLESARDTPAAQPSPERRSTGSATKQVRRGRCSHLGKMVERWPSNCRTNVWKYSLRVCNYPTALGTCTRVDHQAHRVNGIRVCYGRDCPLVDRPASVADRPDGPSVRPEVMAEALDRARAFVNGLGPYPGGRTGRGVVYVGGGKYEAGIYCGVRMLRDLGCTLPVQVWHRGTHELVSVAVRDLPGVTVIDAETHPDRNKWRRLGGWELKMTAALNSGFREVIYADADAYFVADPTSLLDADRSVVFLDFDWNHGAVQWPAYGLEPPPDGPGWNGGMWMFDLSAVWDAVNLAHHFDMYSDYWYTKGYGDQDQLRAAFHWTGAAHRIYGPPVEHPGIMVWPGPDGKPLAVHRIRGKPGPPGAFSPRIIYHDYLPRERELWVYLADWARLTNRPGPVFPPAERPNRRPVWR